MHQLRATLFALLVAAIASGATAHADADPAPPTPPTIATFVGAEYPVAARAAGREAAVELELTVGVDGQVLDARVVKDTLGSDHLKQCILAQVREWKFASVPGGEAEFQAPFVFTPPVK